MYEETLDRGRAGLTVERKAATSSVDVHETAATVTSADGTTIGYTTLGSGPALILVGGVLRTGRDYAGLARALTGAFTVHVIDRRGRGASGPQGANYGVARECEDLLAVQDKTGAELIFGHSFGGFVALQAARRTMAFRQLAVYEPMIPINGSPPLDWVSRYHEHLETGDTRAAFATMVKHAGFAPAPLAAMPLWAVQLILRLGLRGRAWRDTEGLLEANLAEQQALIDDGDVSQYGQIPTDVLLIGGAKSPPVIARNLATLQSIIPRSTLTIIDRLDHPAPETHPVPVARCLERFFTTPRA